MARACSYGVPLPPIGGGYPSLCTFSICSSIPVSSPPICIAVEGLIRSRAPPPISCIRPRTKVVCSWSGDAPLSLSCLGSPPPFPLLHVVRKGHTLLRGPPPSTPWSGSPPSLSCKPCTGSARFLGGTPPSPSWSGVPPPLPLLYAMHWKRTLLGGCPAVAFLVQGTPPLPLLNAVREVHMLQFRGPLPSSSPWLCTRVARCLVVAVPFLPCPRAGCARCWVGGLPSSSIP